ncbi:MAG: hypothetical protein CM15mV41_0100 [Caudoviricetes sp.]|nr:MAG: hypothetical protein CM15mV41_0100 [Caudoviricetes sp.]
MLKLSPGGKAPKYYDSAFKFLKRKKKQILLVGALSLPFKKRGFPMVKAGFKIAGKKQHKLGKFGVFSSFAAKEKAEKKSKGRSLKKEAPKSPSG